jgi:hypothetical protein
MLFKDYLDKDIGANLSYGMLRAFLEGYIKPTYGANFLD